MGPTPWALTIHQMKKTIPAIGTKIAFSVNRCRLLMNMFINKQTYAWSWLITHILWRGNHKAGKEISQNKKKHIKSRVLVPEEIGMVFAAPMNMEHYT